MTAIEDAPHTVTANMSADAVEEVDLTPFLEGAPLFLGGMANVIMQLSHPAVGYGVYESPVESGRIDKHPVKRLRTTLTYIGVALLGTEEERAAYRQAVNGSHRQVRSSPDSPVKYNAFDPRLQLWVAACIAWGGLDLHRRMHGPIDAELGAKVYAETARLGTTLQMPESLWPADGEAFEDYIQAELATRVIDDTIREYFDGLIDLTMMPWPVRVLAAPVHRFFVTGTLPPPLRAQMRMSWTPRQERTLTIIMRTLGLIYRRLPTVLRSFPINYYMWDLRRRIQQGKPLV